MHAAHIRRGASVVLLTVCAIALVGCSSDDKSDTSTTSTTSTTTGSKSAVVTIRFDKSIQEELAAVGCYDSPVDGILGPETDAAIVAFQRGSGLTVDGELGPKTAAALKVAATAKRKVCDASTTTTSTRVTTTTAGSGGAPCTVVAIRAAGMGNDSDTIASFICTDGYAAGTLSTGAKFIVKSDDGRWTVLAQSPCGSASAGLPTAILEAGCA